MKTTCLWIAIIFLSCTTSAKADCHVHEPDKAGGPRNDLFARLLREDVDCPTQAVSLRAALRSAGYTIRSTLVANRGYHAPQAGSFSFFEIVEGEGKHGFAALGSAYFGHFTELRGERLALSQSPDAGALLVELLAWDEIKGLYNFYEVRGDGTQGAWFYRGDSADIAEDIQALFRQSPPVFGTRLRCSGCHLNGGPIMKELTAPHNDWWRHDRPIPLGHKPDADVRQIIEEMQDASILSEAVMAGMSQLVTRNALRSWYLDHWQQALRPLFCPHEINLVSDFRPNDSALNVWAPSDFAIDTRFEHTSWEISRAAYAEALTSLNMRFEQTDQRDADHAFLTPVRARSDAMMLWPWLSSGIIDVELVDDVLAIDMQRPLASPLRCGLLETIPERWTEDWQNEWTRRLRNMAATGPLSLRSAATELLANRADPRRNSAWHRNRAAAFSLACAERLRDADAAGLLPYVQLLAQRRSEVASSPISKNPLGQILEPGFRVIFPRPETMKSGWTLDAQCHVQPL